jgi:hypothetical protein
VKRNILILVQGNVARGRRKVGSEELFTTLLDEQNKEGETGQ